MSIKKMNISDLADMIANGLKKADPEREVEFRIAEGLVAYGDEQLLHAVLENLLGNAWKFTGKCPKATIEFGMTVTDDKSVYFVKDNGVGFDNAYVEKLFLPFQRLHTTEEFPGTGIGLATVKRIIERHDGRICLEGGMGKGTTVFFTLE